MAVNKKTKSEEFLDYIEKVEDEPNRFEGKKVVFRDFGEDPKDLEKYEEMRDKLNDLNGSPLPSVEAEYVEETNAQYGDWYLYERIRLNELGDGDEYMGKPLLLPVETVQFDEEEDPRYRARLLLIDDDEEEYLEININVKQKGDIQTNVHNASSLYALIGGIQNLSNPQWTQMFNRIKRVDLSEWETYINSKESMTVEIITKTGSFSYNSFRITDLS